MKLWTERSLAWIIYRQSCVRCKVLLLWTLLRTVQMRIAFRNPMLERGI